MGNSGENVRATSSSMGVANGAGADRIDANPVISVVERESPGKAQNCTFRTNIGGDATLTGMPLNGRKVQNRTAAALFLLGNA